MSQYSANPDVQLSRPGRRGGSDLTPHTHGTPHTCPGSRLDKPIERVAYGLAEASEALGIGVTCLREIVAQGELPTWKVGRRVLIRRRDLEAFADRLFCEQNGGEF